MTPFPSSGDAPAGGVTFSRARESNQRARIGGNPLCTPVSLGKRCAGVPGARGRDWLLPDWCCRLCVGMIAGGSHGSRLRGAA